MLYNDHSIYAVTLDTWSERILLAQLREGVWHTFPQCPGGPKEWFANFRDKIDLVALKDFIATFPHPGTATLKKHYWEFLKSV